jgi:hypothetical protein
MPTASAGPHLTIRYVVEDDTFAVVDVSGHNRVLQGGFKNSGDAQRYADLLFEETNKSASTATAPDHQPHRGEK